MVEVEVEEEVEEGGCYSYSAWRSMVGILASPGAMDSQARWWGVPRHWGRVKGMRWDR